MRPPIIFLFATLGAAGCEQAVVEPAGKAGNAASHAAPVPPRWYWPEQVTRGADLFRTHCAECHGQDAAGTANWRQPGPDGKYPPPPLNGTAHTWHHPLSALRRTVRIGGIPLGGSMPAFADKLDAEEVDAVLAWVQSHWSDEIYSIWHERNVQVDGGIRAIAKD